MQQLEIEHKKSINNSKIVSENKSEESINKREASGQTLALARKVLRILNSDTFYCHSESKDIWYFVKYMPSVFEWCSCFDNSMRSVKCKHIFAVEYSIRKGTLVDVEHPNIKRDNMVSKDWRNDDYVF